MSYKPDMSGLSIEQRTEYMKASSLAHIVERLDTLIGVLNPKPAKAKSSPRPSVEIKQLTGFSGNGSIENNLKRHSEWQEARRISIQAKPNTGTAIVHCCTDALQHLVHCLIGWARQVKLLCPSATKSQFSHDDVSNSSVGGTPKPGTPGTELHPGVPRGETK